MILTNPETAALIDDHQKLVRLSIVGCSLSTHVTSRSGPLCGGRGSKLARGLGLGFEAPGKQDTQTFQSLPKQNSGPLPT